MKLAISAGHGLGTPGKEVLASLDSKRTKEWVLNSRIVEKVLKKLEAYEGYQVLRVDDPTGKRDVPLSERTKKANDWGSDFYLAVHTNAGINGGSGGGIVVYRYTNSSLKSKELQPKFYNSLIKHTGLKGNRSQPLASANLHEVREPKSPALLLELGFMDSRVDVPIILSEKFADQCATAIVEVLVSEFGLKLKPVEVKPQDTIAPHGKIFMVKFGAYKSKNNAEAMKKRAESLGLPAYITLDDYKE